MAFRHLMSDVSLATPPSQGMAEIKSRLWKKTLQDAKDALRNRDLTSVAYKRGCNSIDALATKSDAEAYSLGALKTYRYIGETQARALLSASYEDMLPFDCSFQWSAAETEKRLSQLRWLLSPVTTGHTSRIIRHFPVAVIASMMDFMATPSGSEVTWWDNGQNRKSVVTKAMKMMQGFDNLSLSEDDAKLIKACVVLFYRVSLQIPHFDDNTSLFVEFADTIEREFMKRIRESASDSHDDQKPASGLVYVQTQDVEYNMQQMTIINPSMAAEHSLSFMLQTNLINSSDSAVLPSICCRNEHEEEHRGKLELCMDNLILDTVRMLLDMARCIRKLRSDESDEIMDHLMSFCGEYWDKKRRLHIRKLFMLSIVLTEGIDVYKVDNSELVSDIVDKIDDDGSFFEARKRRVNMRNRQNKRLRKKRGPCFQPKVYKKRGEESSDEEDIQQAHSPPQKKHKPDSEHAQAANIGNSDAIGNHHHDAKSIEEAIQSNDNLDDVSEEENAGNRKSPTGLRMSLQSPRETDNSLQYPHLALASKTAPPQTRFTKKESSEQNPTPATSSLSRPSPFKAAFAPFRAPTAHLQPLKTPQLASLRTPSLKPQTVNRSTTHSKLPKTPQPASNQTTTVSLQLVDWPTAHQHTPEKPNRASHLATSLPEKKESAPTAPSQSPRALKWNSNSTKFSQSQTVTNSGKKKLQEKSGKAIENCVTNNPKPSYVDDALVNDVFGHDMTESPLKESPTRASQPHRSRSTKQSGVEETSEFQTAINTSKQPSQALLTLRRSSRIKNQNNDLH